MELQTEKKFAYGVLCILFIVGIICYAAFPVPEPEEPVRILLKSTAGNVLFDHKEHASEDGYGYECIDCHLCEKNCEGACSPTSQIRINECVLCMNCLNECRHHLMTYQIASSAAGEILGLLDPITLTSYAIAGFSSVVIVVMTILILRHRKTTLTNSTVHTVH